MCLMMKNTFCYLAKFKNKGWKSIFSQLCRFAKKEEIMSTHYTMRNMFLSLYIKCTLTDNKIFLSESKCHINGSQLPIYIFYIGQGTSFCQPFLFFNGQ